MKKMNKSQKIYLFLIVLLAFLSALNVYLPQGYMFSLENLPASKPIIALANFGLILLLYGILGCIGLSLSQKLNIPGLYNSKISDKQRFLLPAYIGIAIGIIFILVDTIFQQLHKLGPLPHPPFPTSLVASLSAAIGEEIIFRLFFISFWVWIISHVILKKRWKNHIFLIITLLSALLFSITHLPSIMILYEFDSLSAMPGALVIEIFLLNGLLSIFAAYYWKKFGFLAAVSIHFWTDFVWHVVWGLMK